MKIIRPDRSKDKVLNAILALHQVNETLAQAIETINEISATDVMEISEVLTGGNQSHASYQMQDLMYVVQLIDNNTNQLECVKDTLLRPITEALEECDLELRQMRKRDALKQNAEDSLAIAAHG